MDPDLILGVAMLLAGVVISAWMFRIRGGRASIVIGLCLVFVGLVSIASSVVPKGPGKTAMLASFVIVSTIFLFLTVLRKLVAPPNPEP